MQPTLLGLFGLVVSVALLSGCSAAAPSPASPDGYQVIMWVLGGVPENEVLFSGRMHDLHVTAIQVSRGESGDVARRNGLDFYVENIHRIGFLHEANKVYQADWDGYTKTRDKRFLIRKPCLHDPAYLAQAKEIFQTTARQYVEARPLLYDIGDECSITSFASPMDYCFSDHTLAAFRAWLREQYGSLSRLNAEWETNFATWDAVVPMTTYEIKDRERGVSSAVAKASADKENYSPWADHRTFMDLTYAQTVDQFRRWLHEVNPRTPAGLEGTQMPAAFGGYDLWRLSQVLDWVEPYDIAGSRAIFRSFLPPGTPVYATLFEHDAKQAGRRLWHLLLNGDRGTIIWCSDDWFDYHSPEFTPKPWVAGMAELFAELQGPTARAIMQARRDRAPIAIHYSQPSVQAAWMIDSRADGDTWPRRFSSYEGVHSSLARVRTSWMKLIEDLGFQYDFVSSQQIVEGELGKRGYQVLVLPESLAIGDQEAKQIEAFARQGGTVIADFLPGVFDEHCGRRERGALDDLFGVSRAEMTGMIAIPEASFEAGTERPILAEPKLSHEGGSVTVSPPPIRQSVGKGRAWYLDYSPIEYAKLRLSGKGDYFRELLGGILSQAGVAPNVAVTLGGKPPVGCEVITYQGEGCRYVAIMRNPEYEVSDLGEIGYGDNSRFEQGDKVTLQFSSPVQARELPSGQTFGRTRKLDLTLSPWQPLVVEVR